MGNVGEGGRKQLLFVITFCVMWWLAMPHAKKFQLRSAHIEIWNELDEPSNLKNKVPYWWFLLPIKKCNFKSAKIIVQTLFQATKKLLVNKTDLQVQALTLLGPTRQEPVLDPLDVLHLDNQL